MTEQIDRFCSLNDSEKLKLFIANALVYEENWLDKNVNIYLLGPYAQKIYFY